MGVCVGLGYHSIYKALTVHSKKECWEIGSRIASELLDELINKLKTIALSKKTISKKAVSPLRGPLHTKIKKKSL